MTRGFSASDESVPYIVFQGTPSEKHRSFAGVHPYGALDLVRASTLWVLASLKLGFPPGDRQLQLLTIL